VPATGIMADIDALSSSTSAAPFAAACRFETDVIVDWPDAPVVAPAEAAPAEAAPVVAPAAGVPAAAPVPPTAATASTAPDAAPPAPFASTADPLPCPAPFDPAGALVPAETRAAPKDPGSGVASTAMAPRVRTAFFTVRSELGSSDFAVPPLPGDRRSDLRIEAVAAGRAHAEAAPP
jgi:ribonuclease E